jgi:hypothetical protein
LEEVERQSGISSCSKDCVISLPSGIGQGSHNIFLFEIRKILQDFLVGNAFSQHSQNIRNPNPRMQGRLPHLSGSRVMRRAKYLTLRACASCRNNWLRGVPFATKSMIADP